MREHSPPPLPEYEPLSCPLTATARRDLDNIRQNHDYSKYKKTLDLGVSYINDSAGLTGDRLSARKEIARRRAEKRKAAGKGENEKSEPEVQDEAYLRKFEKQVNEWQAKAEKSLRDIIDFKDELAMQETIMRGVSGKIAETPVPVVSEDRQRRRRGSSVPSEENEQEEREESPGEDVEVLSPLELLQNAREEYHAKYNEQTMRTRYDVNDYRAFKKVSHDAKYPNSEAPPLPNAKYWFPEDNPSGTQGPNGSNEAEDSDDEVVIERETIDLKDPFTLQYFKEPMTSSVCRHTFDKTSFMSYWADQGTVFRAGTQPPNRGPAPRHGVKLAKCPMSGCDAMLEPNLMLFDPIIARQVQRAKAAEEEGVDDLDSDLDDVPRGSQRPRPTQLSSDVDDGEEEEEDSAEKVRQIKRERQQSRVPSSVPKHRGSTQQEEDVEMSD